MPYERGGRADKYGNAYETLWVIYQLLDVIDEKISSVTLEAIGEEEEGVDIWVNKKDGYREAQQCKGRNASKEYWDMPSLKSRKIIKKSKIQLDRNPKYKFALVSPIACSNLFDLTKRARNWNGNIQDFIEFQINNSSKEFQNFFDEYCKELELKKENPEELKKVINYLSRTYYYQFPDSKTSKDQVIDKIKFLLIGNPNNIYSLLKNYILEYDVLGKEITQAMLVNVLNDNEFKLRNLANDTRLLPRVNELNREYKQAFVPIDKQLFERKIFDDCTTEISAGNSLIIHGRAGSGKSGCTQAIIKYCESNNIPYIAIKLDKRIPNNSSEAFGHELGLPASITHCMASLSQNEHSVIILDQLDALRWTQNHSRSALDVCSEMINEVRNINQERENKISIVLVSRTYDLENDNNIKSLFINNDEKGNNNVWKKIAVGEFDDELVKKVVGDYYVGLTEKLKKVLRIPNNLYIWQQLDKSKNYNEFSTANQLLYAWWEQLCKKCQLNDVQENEIIDLKEQLVRLFEKSNKLYVNKKFIKCSSKSIEYLVSNGMLSISGAKISFVHQSMFDYFLVESMSLRFFNGESIEQIIGPKEKQTPTRRYQIQMLLQNIEDDDINCFIEVGKQILQSKFIRFYVKYVFLELLDQCTQLTSSVKKFVMDFIEDERYRTHILKSVVSGHKVFVEFLIDEGYIDNLFCNENQKELAINLLVNVGECNSLKVANVIEKYAFVSKEDDYKLIRIFSFNVTDDSDEMFALRMKFFEKYPELININLNIREMFNKSEERAIKIIQLMLEHKVKNKEKSVYSYEEEFLDEYNKVIVTKGEEIVEAFLSYVPLETDYYKVCYSNWGAMHLYDNNIEKVSISILKKSIVAVVRKNPMWFWHKFSKYFGKGYLLINGLILCGLSEMPKEYSDRVIEYLCSDINKNIFDITSKSEDELETVKQIIAQYSDGCSIENFKKLEEKLYYFHETNEKELYKRRIEVNSTNEYGEKVYWAFWGEVQIRLLPALFEGRVTTKTKDLIRILNRKFNGKYILHNNSGVNMHSGSVYSGIAGKENLLSNEQWRQILVNKKLKFRNHSNWVEKKGRFIENSIEEFSSSFRSAVSNEPERFLLFITKIKVQIPKQYIEALFSGLAYSNKLSEVSLELIEDIILKYKYDNESYSASSICDIIGNRAEGKWSEKVLDILCDIALNHKNPEEGMVNVTSSEDKEMKSLDMLISNSLNCVRGNAARTIAKLLWNELGLYVKFKYVVSKLLKDIHQAVKMAVIECLCPIYNIDRKWAAQNVIRLFKEDYRFVGHPSAKQFLFLLHSSYKEDVLEIVKKCYSCKDKRLIEIGANCICEMYILYDDFETEVFDVYNMNDEQAKGITEMAVLYFNNSLYTEKIKTILRRFFSSEKNLEYSFSRLFYDKCIDLNRDSQFLLEMMKSKLSRRIIRAFVNYLEESAESVMKFSDIIIQMSRSILHRNLKNNPDGSDWGIDDEISKLIAALYDESTNPIDNNFEIEQQCLDIWDLMFENRIGSIWRLSKDILER